MFGAACRLRQLLPPARQRQRRQRALRQIVRREVALNAAHLQRQRVMARGTMTEAQFDQIRARQMPDAEKRARATHIVETLDLASTRAYVDALIVHIRGRHA